MAKVQVLNVSKTWFSADGKRGVLALQNLTFEVKQEQFVSVLGPSGCGKSTLLYLLAGLDFPSAGNILVDGNPVRGPSWERGLVFQDHALFPWRSVRGNVEFGLEARGVRRRQRAEIVDHYIQLVGLRGFEDSYPSELSGGMRQRVALARALANDPGLLLMDEPFGLLDAQTRNTLQDELLTIWDRVKKTVVFVTHDLVEAVYLADRVVVMSHRPGTIKSIVDVDLPRPRRKRSLEFISLCDTVEASLREEAAVVKTREE